MTRLILSELYKAICSRLVWVLLTAECVVVGVFSLEVGVPGVQLAMMLAVLLGVSLMAAEYPARTIWLTVVAARDRQRVFMAQACSLALIVAVPVVLVMLVLTVVRNPYVHFDGRPYSVGGALVLMLRAAFVVVLAGLVGGFLGAGMRSTTTAMVTVALLVGLGQLLLPLVSGIFSGGGTVYFFPEWANSILPNSVLTRLLGGDFASSVSWWDSPVMTLIEALAWTCPLAVWACWRVVRSDF